MGTIPSHTIEEIAAANDIVEVIGSYFPLKRAGSSYKALCPFHQEKTPSFTVSPPRQTFHCFGCGVGGSVFRFVMEYEHIDFPMAVRRLATRAGIPIVEEGSWDGDEERSRSARQAALQLHAEAADWFHQNLLDKETGAAARKYLKGRGIGHPIATNWKIGFAPESWDAFLNWAHERGYRREQLLTSGLVKLRDETRSEGDVYDRFRNRIMFPIHNDVGEVIAFSGRILEESANAPKYLNSPETPLFRKGSVLFGLHKTKRALIEAKVAIVCEGQLDLITLFEAGITNVVAPQGTAFTPQQARVLKRYVEEVVLCFDSDSAGQQAAERSLPALLENNLVIRVAEVPAGEDPDSLVRKNGRDALEELVAQAPDFFDFWLERSMHGADKKSLAARVNVARKLADTIGMIRDRPLRHSVTQRASARLGLALSDFETLLPAERPGSAAREREERTRPPATAPRHDIATLSLLALRDRAAREYLLAQPWISVLEEIPGSELLEKILAAELQPDEPSSLNAFMATLAPEEEALVSGWLMQKMPPNTADVTRDWWTGLQQNVLRRQLEVAENKMKLPHLTPGEVVTLQKQILDLQEQLRDLSRLLPPRSQAS